MAVTEFPFYVVVSKNPDIEDVYQAINLGNWYTSQMAAEATADQYTYKFGHKFVVIGAELKEIKL